MTGVDDRWQQVAAPGTSAPRLAQTVALLSDAVGRRVLRATAERAAGEAIPSLLEEVGDAAELPPATPAQRSAADDALAAWLRLGVRAALLGDPTWPRRLRRLASPPRLLGWRGPATLDRVLDRPTVAIVGARRATPYGTGVAAWLAEAAADAGVTVISGGARGIDGAAHGAAAHGGTAVVLGCGHDVPYPRQHAGPGGLFDRVLDAGGVVLSELLPSWQPRPEAVRARNRIVAALADVVVVVEGGDRSGALLTAGFAADAGVEVLAVPGDVRAPGSVAPHRLLSEGAGLCSSPAELLDALGMSQREQAADGAALGAARLPSSVLPPSVRSQLAAAWPRPLRVGELAERSAEPLPRVLAAITRARVAGEVVESSDGIRLRRAP